MKADPLSPPRDYDEKQINNLTIITKTTNNMRKTFSLLALLLLLCTSAWGADKYFILGAQAVGSDGALTKASSHSNLTLKYIKYNGSTYSTTTDISVSATDGINGKFASSDSKANISDILTSSKWGTGSGSAFAAGIKFAKNTTYTLALGSKTISKISLLYYPAGKASSITIGDTEKTTSEKAWTLAEWTGSFTGNVSMVVSDDNPFYGVFVLETPSSHTVTYNANGGSGEIANGTGSSITLSDGTGFTAPSGYSFDGWNTASNGSGTSYLAGASVSTDLVLFAKWTQTVILNANTENHGSGENGSATAIYNGGLSDFIHTSAESGYALKGYFTAATEGTKILNVNGSFASENITDYVTDGVWTKTGATTLYAQYEGAAKYAVTHTLTNVTATSGATGAEAATQGLSYTAVFAASTNYSLPADITVTIGGVEQTEGEGYTYNQASGTVTIPAIYVSGAIVISVTGVRNDCAAPTITKGDFNFANKGYAVTITNNEGGSTLYYSTNGEEWNEYSSALYANATTTYYAKSVKDNYFDGTANLEVTNTFDGEKKYIAWVYESGYADSEISYSFVDDKMVIALQENYNVVPVELAQGTTITTSHDISYSDLIVSTEAMKGNKNLSNSMEVFVGVKPMINLKMWNYGSGSSGTERWAWGTAGNVDASGQITPSNATYKILNGVTLTDGKINMFDGTSGRVQTVTWTSEPTNNVDMGTNTNVAMHAIIDGSNLGKQFFALGLSCNYRTAYSANTTTIIKNAAAILIAGTERLDATVSSVSGTISSTGWSTFSSTYPLDLSSISGGAAYVATSTAADLVTLTPTSAKVASGEGVMIKGTAGNSFTISTTPDAADLAGTNLLVGCPAATVLSTNASHYVMVSNGGVAEFQSLEDNGATIPAGKAYLSLPSLGGAPDRMRIVEAENGATNVNNIEANEKAVKFIENGQIYILRDGVVYDAVGRVIRK